MHESRIAREMKGLPLTSSAGWVSGLNFIESPLFKPSQKISFGKVTLLFGLNGTGKTAICEWLSSTSGLMRLMERWSFRRRSESIRFEVEFFNPDFAKADVSFKDTTYSCNLNGSSIESLRHAFRVIYLRNEKPGHEVPSADVEYLAYQWGIHPFQVPGILSKMGSEKYGFVRKAEVREVRVDEEDENNQEMEQRVFAQVGEHDSLFTFRALSGREHGQVLLIGAMILADELSRVTPTLLIVELPGTSFSDGLLAKYAERLASHEFQFQTILISPNEYEKVSWTGWSIARFRGKMPKIEIHQDDITGEPE